MPEGLITRALSSFYYVKSNNHLWECKARGLFKKHQITPLVGDRVIFEEINDQQGYITEILPRKNELVRPPISNVDQAVLVFSVAEPDFNSTLLDRFLVHVEKAGIPSLICLTKLDLIEDSTIIDEKMDVYQKMGYKVVKTSSKTKNVEELEKELEGKISVFAGQSGVGKSSLLNALIPSLQLETAGISPKLGRGKHTTRVVQMIELPSDGLVADTPGFSQLDFQGIDSNTLGRYFIDIDQFSDRCRFRGCLHVKEPGCAVKEAVENGEISAERYSHYLDFYEEVKEKEEKKWR
ncbi:ribosome small subunit-dependent GTPase A [Tepidibacillus fermentans]|uniref:Small ribosomal subunit biogenesis GTPase RsgA n=1 Tax=Tepidibacillus fermentans TaxID=1281767 RepID=A0A4R3KKF6_9BACI|nr:ribosome small subunit-dependent GTPase A [Tepidibacillus fermentans]TCS84355.1 ribosome biogenesis GTPase [Tepidibacillus fermentans]